jgi:hypothetical protein
MLAKKWFRVICFLVITGFLFFQCVQQKKNETTDLRGTSYAGTAACGKCHSSITDAYLLTAHAKSTSVASSSSIAGSFHADSNHFQYNEHIKVLMEKRDNRFFQAAYQDGVEKASYPFDIVIGSGRKAQTYLYWLDPNAYQLPVSYSVLAKSWVNSPNYPSDKVRFDRIIPVGCFECHSSYIERMGIHAKNGFRVDDFDPNKIIYGIDCERCHGPSAEHVNYQTKHPLEKKAKYISTYKKLSNIQRLENCASCHSGIHETTKSPFRFKPGELLADYFKPDTIKLKPANEIDVHGNQYQLLLASKCFKGSIQEMSCSSCHNPHKQERDNLKMFSVKCMNCHQPTTKNFCSFADQVGTTIINNCIDCHMPNGASKLITLKSEGKKGATPNMVRTHLISVYLEVAQKQILLNKNNK